MYLITESQLRTLSGIGQQFAGLLPVTNNALHRIITAVKQKPAMARAPYHLPEGTTHAAHIPAIPNLHKEQAQFAKENKPRVKVDSNGTATVTLPTGQSFSFTPGVEYPTRKQQIQGVPAQTGQLSAHTCMCAACKGPQGKRTAESYRAATAHEALIALDKVIHHSVKPELRHNPEFVMEVLILIFHDKVNVVKGPIGLHEIDIAFYKLLTVITKRKDNIPNTPSLARLRVSVLTSPDKWMKLINTVDAISMFFPGIFDA